MLGEKVVVQEWQLNCIGNLLNLRIKTTDVDVANVGDFFKQQVLNFGTRQFLEQQVRSAIAADSIATSQMHSP